MKKRFGMALGLFFAVASVALAFGGSPPPPPTPCPLTFNDVINNVYDIVQTGSTTVGLKENGSGGNCIVAKAGRTPITASIKTGSYRGFGNFVLIYMQINGGLSKFAWDNSRLGAVSYDNCLTYSTLCEKVTEFFPGGQRDEYLQFASGVFCSASSNFQTNSVIVLQTDCYFNRKLGRINLTTGQGAEDPRGNPPMGYVRFTDLNFSGTELAKFNVETFFIN
jgi:hypothetical protein